MKKYGYLSLNYPCFPFLLIAEFHMNDIDKWGQSRGGKPHLIAVLHDQNSDVNAYLKSNILYYTEHTLSNYWFYDPVM